MNPSQRRQRVLYILEQRNRYQFGQPYATSSLVQRSGCTDTCIQLTVLMAKRKSVSLNDVRRRSGAPANGPMSTSEALRALHSYGLPYVALAGLKASDVMRIARTRGPVIVAEDYWSHPQWQGYEYMGRKLRGYAVNNIGNAVNVGFAKPLKRAGLTQWTYRDGHAVLVGTDDWRDGKHVAIVRDPNHNSPSRPERPAYDIVTPQQLNRMLGSWHGGSLVLAPTRVVIK